MSSEIRVYQAACALRPQSYYLHAMFMIMAAGRASIKLMAVDRCLRGRSANNTPMICTAAVIKDEDQGFMIRCVLVATNCNLKQTRHCDATLQVSSSGHVRYSSLIRLCFIHFIMNHPAYALGHDVLARHLSLT